MHASLRVLAFRCRGLPRAWAVRWTRPTLHPALEGLELHHQDHRLSSGDGLRHQNHRLPFLGVQVRRGPAAFKSARPPGQTQ